MKRDFKNGLECGFVYAGAVIGAGFASGKELWQFFGRFGSPGLIGLCFAFLLYFLLGLCVFKAVLCNSAEIFSSPAGRIITGLNLAFMFALSVSMTAAAGSLSAALFNIHPYVGCLLFSLIIYFCSLGGKTALLKANDILAPLLMALGVLIGLYICPKSIVALPKGSYSVLPSVFFSSLSYVSYNILTLSAVIEPLKDKLTTPLSRFTAAISGSIIMFVLGVCLFPPIVIYYNISQKSPLPLLSVIRSLNHSLLFALCALLLFAAVFTTAVSNFFGLAENRSLKIPKPLLLFLSFICSLAGFSDIISTIYPFFGILGLLNIAFILYIVL